MNVLVRDCIPEVELVCFDRVFCVAKSSVKIKDKKILAAIARYDFFFSILTTNSHPSHTNTHSNLVGIGQLFLFTCIAKFELLKAERKSNGGLFRHYNLEGDGITCSIQETFSSDLLKLRPK